MESNRKFLKYKWLRDIIDLELWLINEYDGLDMFG